MTHEEKIMLRANRHDNALVDSDGTTLLRVMEALRHKQPDERDQIVKSATTFKKWGATAMGLNHKWVIRINPIVRHPMFSEAANDYCETRYGSQHFRSPTVSSLLDTGKVHAPTAGGLTRQPAAPVEINSDEQEGPVTGA